MALKSLGYKRELAIMKNQEIDIVNFETKLLDFKDKFSKNVKNAGKNFQDAISEIDKAIDQLNKTKESLLLTEKHLNAANNKAEELSVKKLIKGNQTLTEMYDDAWSGGEKVLAEE
jgi:hypothetical protein